MNDERSRESIPSRRSLDVRFASRPQTAARLHAIADLMDEAIARGASADEAFFVRCDETNNPQRTRDLGQLIADVGVAPSVPLEFIVLRVGRVGHELEIEEQGTRGR